MRSLTCEKPAGFSRQKISLNRWCYIAEAGLEYLISLLITDSFLALLLTENGVPDSAAGVITELSSFAFSAQLLSVFFHKRGSVKRFVTVLHLINQLAFMLLYFIPVFDIPSSFKAVLIVILFLGGQLIANAVSPYKISWLMTYVPDDSRGKFTANKEIISLAAGTVFSMAMGSISDFYRENGSENTYFVICGATIFVLALLHTLSVLMVKEDYIKQERNSPNVGFSETVKKTFSDKVLLKIILIDVIWNFSSKLSIAYYGVYKNNELGFTMKYVAFLSLVSAVSRIAFSRFFGKFADRYSWRRMLEICFVIASLSFFINIFTVPSNGKWLFAAYSCIYAVSMAGINSGLMNIIFDYVSPDDRAAALGIKSAFGGTAGFISSFVGGYIVYITQTNNNSLFGFRVYGQQILSALTFILCLCLVAYMHIVFKKRIK